MKISYGLAGTTRDFFDDEHARSMFENTFYVSYIISEGGKYHLGSLHNWSPLSRYFAFLR
jgi:hypothetical protein